MTVGGADQNRPGTIIEGINMTPLVDVMMVLLVIFIATAKVLAVPAVPIDLPKARNSGDAELVFAVSVPAGGPIQVNGQAVADDRALRARAAEALARDPDLRAILQADGAVPHRRVVSALDALRSAGLVRVGFGTRVEIDGEGTAPE